MSIRRPRILDLRICWVVLVAFCTLSLLPADAGAVLVESRLADDGVAAERLEQIETIRQALEREIVAQRLADFGVTAAEIEAKLPTLSDEQLHQLAGLSKDVAAGDGLEVVVAVLVIVLLVIIIVKLLDREIIIR